VIDIIKRMRAGPVMFDGAMGTMLYERGAFVNACFEELCLSNPALVESIHSQYAQAGAEVLETNTFGANAFRLGAFGLADKVGPINRAAVALARRAGGNRIAVGGSVGPCTAQEQAIWGSSPPPEVESAFREQIAALADEGVDLLILETFAQLSELQLAGRIAKEFNLPVLASAAVQEDGRTVAGTRADEIISALQDDPNIDAVGLNCGLGPADMFELARRLIPLGDKPFIVMPNAGLPRCFAGRRLYMTNPEYFTEYAKRFVELGVRGIGGCCGTTPQHIHQACRAIGALSSVKRHVEISPPKSRPAEPITLVAPQDKSRLAGKMLTGQKVSMVEILPPRSGTLKPTIDKCLLCLQAGVDAINIPDGPRASARISPMITALSIEREVRIETILHYCCRDRNLIGMQSDLLGANAAGLRNILIITGDPPKLGNYPDATGVFDVDSIGLVKIVDNLNRGVDLAGSPIDPPTSLFIGVGANPTAVDPAVELDRLCQKVRAGAEFAITQPIFDTSCLLNFLDQIRSAGIEIPIIAGIWPLVSYRNAEFMNNEVPGVVVPAEILERMKQCPTSQQARQGGVEIAREICRQIAPHVAGFQVSAPLGNVEMAIAVLTD